MALANSAEIGQKAKIEYKTKRIQTSTHIQRQNDNCVSVIFLDNLAKNILAVNFRKLEVLKGKIRGMESKKAKLPGISFREQYVGLSYTA